MNLIAIDIGNSRVKVALYCDDEEKWLRSIPGDPALEKTLRQTLREAWERIPFSKAAAEPIRDGVLVASSVKPVWTDLLEKLVREELNEKVLLVGRDIPLPIETSVDNPLEVGTDRLIAAAAAFAVVEDAVVVADFGTAVTIDLVDESGVFVGGTISPGFEIAAKALQENTAKLPRITMAKPVSPNGANTVEAIRSGLYYSALGLLETVCRKFAEQLGRWPQVILTGGGAALIRDDCEFVDSYVPDLTVRGIIIAYKKYLYEKAEIEQLDREHKPKWTSKPPKKE
ncbi:MAG: type III pantothenate kinase [Anaerohalosphaeraceae bacterium]